MLDKTKFVKTLLELNEENIKEVKEFYKGVEDFFDEIENNKILFTEDQLQKLEPLLSEQDEVLFTVLATKYFNKE